MRLRNAQFLTALLLFFSFTLLYSHTRTGVHTFDALSYTKDVESKPFRELYHPHHLLYAPLGRGAVNLAEALGYTGRADQPIQALNALAGALGVVLLWRLGVSLTGKRWLSLPIAMLVGLCYAYWFYATEVEVYTLAAVFIILSLWILTILEREPRWSWVIALALASAGAVMFHQTNLMFAAPVGLFLLADARLRRYAVPYGILVGVLVALPYLLVAWASHLRDADSIYRWLTDYAQSGTWGGYLSLAHRAALWEGLQNTISSHALLAVGFYGLALAGVGLGGRQFGRSWWVFGLSWLVLYGGFFWWWEPWNIEFWIVLLPLWALGMFMGLKSPRAMPSFLLTSAAAMLALLLFFTQYGSIRTAANPEQDYYQQVTRALAPHLVESDVVITRGNVLDLYVPFYADHQNLISMRELHFGGGQALDVILSRADQAYRTGRLVYIDAILLDEPEDAQRNPFGLTVAEIQTLRERFPVQTGVVYEGQKVFYRIGERLPSEATAWNFEQNLQGWLEFGATNARFESGGWCMDGGSDPWLESPPLQLDANRYNQLTIEMAVENATDLYGQVYWRPQGEGLSEERSLRFSLETGRHTYTLSFADQVGWQDTLVFLRFDLISGGQVKTCLYHMQFD